MLQSQIRLSMMSEGTSTILKPANRDGYYVPQCLEGTREHIFSRIDKWLKDTHPETPNMMWIDGAPGAGKSAIASSLISKLKRKGILGAYFFFQRGNADLSNPGALWRTIAFDLAHFHNGIKTDIEQFINMPGYRPNDLELVFDGLIYEPLSKFGNSMEILWKKLPVIVIDALDECDTSEVQQHKQLLNTLIKWCKPRSENKVLRKFKLIFTSRNIRMAPDFYNEHLCNHIVLDTGDQSSQNTTADVERYIKIRFDEIQWKPKDWPRVYEIKQLVVNVAGLFILAQTIMDYISQPHQDRRIILTEILEGKLSEGSQSLDQVYMRVLIDAIPKNSPGTDWKALLRDTLGVIITVKAPIHQNDLLYLMGIEDIEIKKKTDHLISQISPVVSIGRENGKLMVKHRSFVEFLVNENRCTDSELLVDFTKYNHLIGDNCLKVMLQMLRFNMYNFPSSHLKNKDVRNEIPNYIVYSCTYWIVHILGINLGHYQPIVESMRTLLYKKLLFWMEVMSMQRAIDTIPESLETLADAIKDVDEILSLDMKDIILIVLRYFTPISESIPHIYLSMLPFAPKYTFIGKEFISNFQNIVQIKYGAEEKRNPLLLIMRGHDSGISSVAFSPDGKKVASSSADNTIRIWDVQTGKVVFGPLQGHTDWVRSVAFSPDGNRLVSGSDDMTIQIWDVLTGQRVTEPLRGHSSNINSVSFSPDGKQIVSGSADKTIRIWETATGRIILGPLAGHTEWIRSVAYSADGEYIVSGSDDKTIRIWDISTGKTVVGPLQDHTGVVLSVTFSPDGKWVASGSKDKTIRIWDVGTGLQITDPLQGHADWVQSVTFSPDGKHIASCSDDRTIQIWDLTSVSSPKVIGLLQGHSDRITSVAFSNDGKRVVSASDDETIRIWDVLSCHPPATGSSLGHTDRINSVAISHEGTLIASSSDDKSICIWDVKSGQMVAGPWNGHTDWVSSVSFSADDTRLVSGSDDKTVRVWDVNTGQTMNRLFRGHTDNVNSVAFSPDGKWIASGSDDLTIRVWDAITGQDIMDPLCLDFVVTSVVFSPDGKQIISGSIDCTVRIWNVETGEEHIGPLIGHTGWINSVAISPDGTIIASGSRDNTVRIWNRETGEALISPLKGHTNWVTSVCFSPDGKQIASGSVDKTIRIWDAETGNLINGPFHGHTDNVNSVVFLPDGQHVVSGSADKTIRIWNTKSNPAATKLSEDKHFQFMREIGDLSSLVATSINGNGGWIFGRDMQSIKLEDPGNSQHPTVHLSPTQHDRILRPFLKLSTKLKSLKTDTQTASEKFYQPLYLWIPEYAREGICEYVYTHNILNVENMVKLDFSRVVHGEEWVKCYRG